jgi:acyl-CoA thioesterase-2
MQDWDINHIAASLDHAIWFHEPVNVSEFLLYECDSPWAGNARGFNRGQFWSKDGTLLASTTQEALVRPKTR